MNERKRNGILCVFALVCVAILLSTSLIALAGNDSGTNRSVSSYKLESCMHVDKNGYIVAVYDESQEFVGEKERLGERIPSDKEIDVGRLTYETHDDHELSLVDYDGGYRNIVVPDTVLYNGETWFVTEIADWGLSTTYTTGRHPHTVEIGPLIEMMGEYSCDNDGTWGDHTTEFKIRKIDESRLTTIKICSFRSTHISSIELPKSLRVIESDAFTESSLKTAILHSETLEIQSFCFFEDNGLKEINLENVTYVGRKAFGFTSLTHIDLSSATVIKRKAFVVDDTEYIKFSPGLTSVEDEAFFTEDDEPFCFYDINHTKLNQCAEDLRGKTFVRSDMSTLDFIQVL